MLKQFTDLRGAWKERGGWCFLGGLIPQFLLHQHSKRIQSKQYNQLKESAENNDSLAMLQIDFVVNYSKICWGKIQSAHWKRKQITLLTSVLQE